MAPVKPGRFIFDPKSITKVRDKLNLTQKQMSEKLGVPINTLSRWETGATTPDANSLAAIHSLATMQGYTPGFFSKESAVKATATQANKKEGPQESRRRVIVMWDFQNLGVQAQDVQTLTNWIKDQIKNRFPAASAPLLKAFVSPWHREASDALQRSGWRVWEDYDDWDKNIIQQSKADCGNNPNQNVLLLISQDGDFADLMKHLRDKGVPIYVVGPQDTSQKLVQVVGKKHWIKMP